MGREIDQDKVDQLTAALTNGDDELAASLAKSATGHELNTALDQSGK